MEIRMAPKLAMRNKKLLALVSECACYYCLKVYSPSEIKEWVDKSETAICPHCGIDAVLPVYEENEKDLSFLTKINKYWFKSIDKSE